MFPGWLSILYAPVFWLHHLIQLVVNLVDHLITHERAWSLLAGHTGRGVATPGGHTGRIFKSPSSTGIFGDVGGGLFWIGSLAGAISWP